MAITALSGGGSVTVTARRWLLAAVLACEAVFAVVALTHAVGQPVFSNGDEHAHMDYVVKVAHGSMPIVGVTSVDPRVLAVMEHRYPGPPRVSPERAGWAGVSYEGVQPPLYYAVAAPASALSADWPTKVLLLRWFAVAEIAAGMALLVPLARLVCPAAPGLAVAFSWVPFAFPGFADQLVRVSNDALLLPLGIVAVFCLLRAARAGSVRWLTFGAVACGLSVLTKVTAAGLFLIAAGAAVAVVRRRAGSRPPIAAASLAAVIAPGALLVGPWLAWNWSHYHALTATAVLLRLEDPLVNPYGVHYTARSELGKVPWVLTGLVLGQWPADTPTGLVDAARIIGLVLVTSAVAAAVVAGYRRRLAGLVCAAPFLLTAATLVHGAVTHDNPVFHSRLLVGWLPLLLLAPTADRCLPGRWQARAAVGALTVSVAGAALGWAVL